METSQKKFVHDLVAEILALEKNKVINANQNAPKPTKNYCTLRYYSHSQETPGEERISSPGVINVLTSNTVMLEIQMYANAGVDACKALNNLVNRLDAPTVTDQCRQNNIAFFDSSEVQDLTALLDGTIWETRAAVDLTIRYSTEFADDVGYIETVQIIGKTGLLPDETITIEGNE